MRSSDWSSDVCSSDLYNSASNAVADRVRSARPSPPQQTIEPRLPAALRLSTCRTGTNWPALARQPDCQGNETGCGWRERQSAHRRSPEMQRSRIGYRSPQQEEIGRESGRERGGQYVSISVDDG